MMMTKSDGCKQTTFLMPTLDELVAPNHFLKRLAAAIDFSFIYEIVKPLYSTVGRPSVDPVVLIKMLLIGYLFGIDSERKLAEEVRYNIAYRWFLFIELDERVPNHSTFSQNRRRRYHGQEVFRQMFETILRKCMEAGLVKGESIVMDSTHIKANAANDYAESVLLTEGISEYWQKLNEEYGQTIKSKKEDADTTTTQKKTSLSDPEAGWMGRRNKPKGFHYLCNQSADVEYGIVTDV